MFGLLKFSSIATPSRWLWLASVVFVAGLSAVSAEAGPTDHDEHAGDIMLEIEVGKLVTHNGRYFESEFTTLMSGTPSVYRSASPGFDSAAGLLVYDLETENPQQIGFNVLGPLRYWNADELAAPRAGLGLNLIWGPNSLSVTGSNGLVTNGFSLGGATDPNGEFHKHFTFEIAADAPLGAYGVLLELTPAGSSTFAASDPFLIVFNRGLDHEAFESGVDAMVQVTAVPEPSSIALAGLGVAGLAGAALRRRMRKQ
jgi:hypothetical protein